MKLISPTDLTKSRSFIREFLEPVVNNVYTRTAGTAHVRGEKYRRIMEMLPPDEPVLFGNLYENNRTELSSMYTKNTRIMLSRALSWGCKNGILSRDNPGRVPDWFYEIKSVSRWAAQLQGSNMKHPEKKSYDSSTRRQYVQCLWNFNRWITGRTFEIREYWPTPEGTYALRSETRNFENVGDLLDVLERPLADSRNVSRIVKDFLLDRMETHSGSSHIMMYKNSIVSYFDKNEQQLKLSFNPRLSRGRSAYEQSMDLPEFLRFMTDGAPSVMERALFMCKFHRGLDVSTLVDGFNYEVWDQLVQWFHTEDYTSWDLGKCPVPVSLIRVKTGYRHIGFLERDSMVCLTEYLDYRRRATGRPMISGEPLFLNKFGRPVTRSWTFASFVRIADRAGIRKQTIIDGRSRYNLDSHELRDLLKSTLIDCGCRPDVADHVIGHKPRDSYEKQARLYPETLRREYSRASPRLNILTGNAAAPAGDALARCEAAIGEIKLRMQEFDTQIIRMREMAAPG
ncbi:conserved hypothetical protein [Cenarchaeum symbiosum A]|uniref:Tyr recombinase domain-containing protein n=1 Tax=Cenarchaeum symbiosum (strain A) TaxID=414004 RepID=A0RTZ3_CENSY|nr:conserved hypothetical protein [Cenarchaeum symbiosum A]